MPDIATIGAFLTSVKNATDIAKAIRGADVSLEKAETKLKIAELIEALADARMQAADRRIAELEKALELKAKLVRRDDAYYEVNEGGNPAGAPICSHCWEVNHRAVHLNLDFPPITKSCPACKTEYNASFVEDIL
jgi:hypothetical protein